MTFNQMIRRVRFLLHALLLLVLLLPAFSPAAAQSLGPVQTLTGQLTVIYGDSQRGADDSHQAVLLTTDAGQRVLLSIDTALAASVGGLSALNRQRVSVEAQETGGEMLRAVSIRPLGTLPRSTVSGSHPWVTILCRFSDSTGVTPQPKTYFDGFLLGSAYPAMDHYWREVSYDTVNLNGSAVVGWFNLPQPRSYYVYDFTGDGSPDLDWNRAAADCTALADTAIYFPDYDGINLMFNQTLDCCAWGGSNMMTLDGQTKVYRMTWEPPWGYADIGVIAHEMGHGFGFPHSSGPYTATYDSQWDVMSDAWGACRSPDPVYGCIGTHTISYHKAMDGWIPEARQYTALENTNQTIELERLALPVWNAGTYLMAIIPITATTYYTVEARQFDGYDTELPLEGVVLHTVDPSRENQAQVVDVDGNGNPNDAAAAWVPGETFVDAAHQIEVSVLARTAVGYTVNIRYGAVDVPPAAPHGLAVSGLTPTALTLSWQDTQYETGYSIYRSVAGGAFSLLATVAANVTSYRDTTLAPFTEYAYQVSAYNDAGESAPSDPVTVITGYPLPVLSSISPTSAMAGSEPLTLTLNGASFQPVSLAYWNGIPLTTTVLSGTKLSAVVPAALLAAAGTSTVSVVTPEPGGGASSGKTFTINHPSPVIDRLSPQQAQAGGPALTLTVNGSGFDADTVVRWNGLALVTTSINATRLTAAVTADLLADSGAAVVTAFNPKPGGGSSPGMTFSIYNLPPEVMDLSQDHIRAGGGDIYLVIDGEGFLPGAVALWEGEELPTDYIGTTQIGATVPSARMSKPGTFHITVRNPDQGASLSSQEVVLVIDPSEWHLFIPLARRS